MRNSYVYRKAVRRHRYARFRTRFYAAALAVIIVIVVAVLIFLDLRSNKKEPHPVSKVQTETIGDTLNTFQGGPFRFRDTGKWVLNTQESNASKYIFYKYRGLEIQYQLIVYVNQVPIPLYLAVSRALPVRIVSNNSLDVTSISGHCGQSYAVGELHKVKEVTLNGATMLCDPDTSQYSVVLAEIGGNYQLNMQRSDGTPVQFVITFHDLRLEPGSETLKRVATSFQAL